MIRKSLSLFGMFIFALAATIQPRSGQPVDRVYQAPTTCTAGVSVPVSYNGYIYNCVSGTYVATTPGGSVRVAVTATSGGTTTLDLSTGDIREVTFPAGNTTLAFSNIPTGTLTIILIQDSVGGRAVTWPASVKWAVGTPPTLSTAASAVDMFRFTCNGTVCRLQSATFDLR